MTEDRVNLGIVLKAKREELNLSLKEIENSTSIRMNFLNAIEEGKIHEIIAAVYGTGFLRQYILFLGLNDQELKDKFPGAFEIRKDESSPSNGVESLDMQKKEEKSSDLWTNILWATLGLSLLITAFFFARYLGIL